VSDQAVCWICSKPIEPLSGDPGKWLIELEYRGGNGERGTYHASCVISAIYRSEQLTAHIIGCKGCSDCLSESRPSLFNELDTSEG